MSISSVAYDIFVKQGYLWKIGGQRRLPTADDIRVTVEKMIEVLDHDPHSDTIEVGRLLVQKTGTGYAAYIHLGDIPKT